MAARLGFALFLAFALAAPAAAQDTATRIANPGNQSEALEWVTGADNAIPGYSLRFTPQVNALFNAQFTCQKAAFEQAKAKLLKDLEVAIGGARAEADKQAFRSRWDGALASLVGLRDLVAALEYRDCAQPNVAQARAVDAFRAFWGARPVTCADQECPPNVTIVRSYDWTYWPTIGQLFENLMIYQRICDKDGFEKERKDLQTRLETLPSIGQADAPYGGSREDALKALEAIQYVPCETPKTRTATTGAPTSDAGAGTSGTSGQETGQAQDTPSGTPRDSGRGAESRDAPSGLEDEPLPGLDDEPLPGIDDDSIGLLDLWLGPELSVPVSVTGSFDGPSANYGQFVQSGQTGQFNQTGQTVFSAPGDLDPVCGGLDWSGPFGQFFGSAGTNSRLSLSGNICGGDDDRHLRNVQTNQDFLLGQPNGNTQLINGLIQFDRISFDREYDSASARVGLGAPLVYNGGLLITGEIFGGLRYLETEDRARFTAGSINFQSTSTQEVESWSGGVGIAPSLYFSPSGSRVPEVGLQTIFVAGHAAIYGSDADGSDTFSTSQAQVFNETQRLDFSEDEFTTSYGVTAGLRIGLGPNLAFTVEGFWESMEEPFIRRQVGQQSRIDFEHVDYGGVRGQVVFRTSDRRLKRDIEAVTTTDGGIRLYRFRYLWDERVHVGVMAQDLLTDPRYAHAVARRADGFYAVNYSALGLEMTSFEDWRTRGATSVASQM